MKRIDVKVWFACNNFCLFCVQWDKRFKYKPKKIEEIKRILDEWISDWAEYVVFTGWEPTVHPKLTEAVKHAKKVWYKQIQIQSNWVNFSNMDYCKELIMAWVTEFSPSIHWFKAETHDKLVWTPWAWKNVVKWLINLSSLWQLIIINSVITKDNYKETPKLAKLLCKIWVHQYQFAFVHILWSAAKNKEIIVPKKSEIMPYIKEALDIWRRLWKPTFTEAIPFCMMQWYERAIAETTVPDTAVYDWEWKLDSYSDYRWSEGKAKRDECKKCIKNSVCEWPWREYPDLYWWDEFKPIK
jgi:MoaA/NifB/PqqE/SkfB family radical SAM enzyme